jgi:hypothetical protein
MCLRPQGTTRLPLEEFSLLLVLGVFLEKTRREKSSFIKIGQIYVNLQEDQYKFLTISYSVLLKMRNVSHKVSRGNQNTLFVFIDFFFEIHGFYEIMWKNIVKRGRP